ncbi:centrosomal protein of 120 kDa-like isoform X1 [Salarias fasciatus]|uniref:centrosomal protein of 120 kDa-like isoform X1 n=1 Tax=Salarias fasciatus TaxID=181472 RepID=UPI001176B11B|nr:centrosomal protein of 120 kDa-like isoform X1 [Salarias fasciatus]
MSAKTDQLLVVVSILEGRHFPKNPRLSLVVQASFDGEQLATDPAEHREQPQFHTELAWELDRRTLHQHRLQRTPIKLHCFAVDGVSKKKESVGYIVLDLRSVQEVKQEPRWFPLLSSKYVKQRPSLLLAVALENDSKPSGSSPDRFKARKAPPRQGSPSVTDLLPDKLEAVLVPDKGYHQVGPADLCSDMFVLSVTVAFATKLEQLIPSSLTLSSEGHSFFFYYCLLGNDISSEPFHNLLSPDFQPERASVRLRSSPAVLQAFLSRQPGLQVHLCCGSRSLGSADVPLSPLSAAPSHLDAAPATVEGAFVLRPPDCVRRRQQPALPADQQPTVGVAVLLRREELAPQVRSPPAPSPPGSPPLLRQPASPPRPPPSCHTESEVESLLEELQRGGESAAPADSEVPAQIPSEPPDAPAASSLSVSAPKVSIPSSAHHFCFSLDLCSLRSLRLTHPIAATLRYSYRFFGSAAPIMTNPPVELQRNAEVFLPQSFCAFDFAALPQQLHDTFLRVPLVVELWHRDAGSGDQLTGRASIPLSGLLSPDGGRVWSTAERGCPHTQQDVVPVLSALRPTERVAELRYTATLQDLGLVKAPEVILSDSSQKEAPVHTQPPPPHRGGQAPADPTVLPPPPAPRETLEYHAALELELWKEEQESQFEDQLRKKELTHMQALAEEWRKRDREREAVMKKKEVEYGLLEERLQKTLSDLERREKLLAEAELETRRLQRELQAEHQLSQRELQESSRRLQQQCDHRVALERDKVQLMEEERGRLLQQIADGECRYKQLEKEFSLYREQQSSRPEVRLQADVNLLTLEKVELERKLESTTKSKLHYKQQWGRALKELARFKQREQENAMTRLKKQQEELEAMRLRYLAAEEKEAVRQDRQELDGIRNQLNRLKQQEETLAPPPVVSDPAPNVSGPAPSPGLTESAEEHLSRLLEERDTLLRTGVYSHEDWIISELNRQIQDAIRDRKQL